MELNNLSDIFQSKLRLMIISSLMTSKRTFKEIKHITGATDGNISVQITKLEKSGFISVEKTFVDKKPQTILSITDYGSHEFISYIEMLNRILTNSLPNHLNDE